MLPRNREEREISCGMFLARGCFTLCTRFDCFVGAAVHRGWWTPSGDVTEITVDCIDIEANIPNLKLPPPALYDENEFIY